MLELGIHFGPHEQQKAISDSPPDLGPKGNEVRMPDAISSPVQSRLGLYEALCDPQKPFSTVPIGTKFLRTTPTTPSTPTRVVTVPKGSPSEIQTI